MPHAIISSVGVPTVEIFTSALRDLLHSARSRKKTSLIDSPLDDPEFDTEIDRFRKLEGSPELDQVVNFAAIETAFRIVFQEILFTASISEPSFDIIWHILDIASTLSDHGSCEGGLAFWLIEELLESQTIEGCKIVFNYLESRRERLTAKNMKAKQLIALRTCNELLKRLSRAEDAEFCGRVFIFQFQSFPYGDKSSVNLRGEYHSDNVTVWDDLQQPTNGLAMEMDVDSKEPLPVADDEALAETRLSKNPSSDVKFESKIDKPIEDEAKSPSLSMDQLYPIFWKLQTSFAKPTQLFQPTNLEEFKNGLIATLAKFKEVQKDTENFGNSKSSDNAKQGTKRKRGMDNTSSFNAKYLTSRDLFDLEVKDIAFQRHVLVQALILIDFLLSLTPKSRAKLQNMKNKSVLYDFTLEQQEAQWATKLRSDIASYLQQGLEGKFYYRMVDTVLTRDKNWARWKAENCPPFQRDTLSSDDFATAKSGAQAVGTNKRIRAVPMGTLDLKFLADEHQKQGLERLKERNRYRIPEPASFRASIQDDAFDMDTARTSEAKDLASQAHASKLWRMLRAASGIPGMLRRFDKIEDGNKLDALFVEESTDETSAESAGSGETAPSSRPAVEEPCEVAT